MSFNPLPSLRSLRNAFLIAPLFLLLVGCASDPTSLLSPDALYPPAITTCKDEPVVPERPAADQPRTAEQKAGYTADLHDAWADCHDTVGATAKRKADYTKQYQTATEPAWKKVVPHISFGNKKKD